MRPKKFKEQARISLKCELADKRGAEKVLKSTPFTISDYLQQCLRLLATGEVTVEDVDSKPDPVFKI